MIHFENSILFFDVIGVTWNEEDEHNQNEENYRLGLPMETNEYDDSHRNSANTIPTTNHCHHQTPKNTGVYVINHIFKATEWSLFTFRYKISE